MKVLTAAVLISVVLLTGCGAGGVLIRIFVQPNSAAITVTGPPLQLHAIGQWSGPYKLQDITDGVKWTSDIPQIAAVSSTGLVSPGTMCGATTIRATVNTQHIGLVSGTATITVTCQ